MELQYGFLYSQETKLSLDKVFSANLHGPLLRNVNALHRQCEKEFLELKKKFQAEIKKYAELDEKGELVEGNGPGSYKIKPENAKAWNEAVAKMMLEKFEVKGFSPIDVDQLYNSGIALSSLDIQNIEPILCGLE